MDEKYPAPEPLSSEALDELNKTVTHNVPLATSAFLTRLVQIKYPNGNPSCQCFLEQTESSSSENKISDITSDLVSSLKQLKVSCKICEGRHDEIEIAFKGWHECMKSLDSLKTYHDQCKKLSQENSKVKNDSGNEEGKLVPSTFGPGIAHRPLPPVKLRMNRKCFRVHFIRHAEATHNVRKGVYTLVKDPPLTPMGERQAACLRDRFEFMNDISLILCSPMRRTLQTALIAFEKRLVPDPQTGMNGINMIALPDFREFGNGNASTGSPVEVIEKELEKAGKRNLVDLSLVHQGWEENRETRGDMARTLRVREFLHSICLEFENRDVTFTPTRGGAKYNAKFDPLKHVDIAIVSHAAFLGSVIDGKCNFYNAEYKSYEFGDGKYILPIIHDRHPWGPPAEDL